MITLNGTTGITNDGGYTGDGVVFADTTPANTLVTTTGGNVGIGTSSPSYRLQIQQLQEKVLEVEEGTSNMLVENTNNLHEIITALTARVSALEGTQNV